MCGRRGAEVYTGRIYKYTWRTGLVSTQEEKEENKYVMGQVRG